MEAALLVLAHKGGVLHDEAARTLARLAEILFDAAHKFMATFHRDGAQVRVFIKGAPDVLLGLCTQVLTENGASTIDLAAREEIQPHYAELAKQGLRGLLIASRSVDANSSGAPAAFNASGDLSAWVADLTFVALVGLVDPPRAEAKAAIAQCRQAGITVKMITGDHPLTAAAIAAQLGLDGRAMTGAELKLIGPAELPDAIKNVAVFARVTPVTKVNIVRALQKSGHVVAMTGDGVNDDNFATLVSAVRQGRTLYDNIVNVCPLPAVDHDRCDFDGAYCAADWPAGALYRSADSLGRHHHGRPTRRFART